MATIKAHDTFWQRRIIRGLQPILMEVLEVEERIGTRDICKVRWFVLSKDAAHESVFPTCTITDGHFASFVPIPREQYDKALGMLQEQGAHYPNIKRRILYLMKDYRYTDDPPWSSN